MSKQPNGHPWRILPNKLRAGWGQRAAAQEFIELKAKNPNHIVPTICPPGNAEDCVLGLDCAVYPATINDKDLGKVYVGGE